MYRAVRIGVVPLAAGTTLRRRVGPKEVWALITLLLYLAVLHGRFTGWLRDFDFVAGTVLCFLAVLMAWYGVNFIFGVGLHAYGFGTGGIFWVGLFVAAQVAFIVAAYFQYLRKPAAVRG